jgi:hypothetical protein
VPHFDQAAAERKIRELLRAHMPRVEPLRVEVREGADFSGDPSLFVDIVLRKRPVPYRPGEKSAIIRSFRTWLAKEAEDDRFPYLRLVSEADLRELTV